MARSEAQRARARAQRATAVRVRNRTRILPKSITGPSRKAQIEYVQAVQRGDISEPAPGTPEARQLARWASYARWNKADPTFEARFSKYFYHGKEQNFGPDADRYEEGNTSDIEDDEDEE